MSSNQNKNDDEDTNKAELKRRKYKLSKKIKNIQSDQSEQEQLFLNTNQQILNKNVNIELNDMSRKQKTEQSTSCKQKQAPFYYKIDSLLDFNSKFSSIEFENIFKSSYLSVTRSLYIKYLFYLIVFTFSWLTYFLLNSNQNQIDHTSIYATITTYTTSGSLNETTYSIIRTPPIQNASKIVLVAYLTLMALVFAGIFIFLIILELKEKEYRKMEKKLNCQEQETKVDFKLAESDLKDAMADVLKKERDYTQLREKFSAKSKLIIELRSLYSKCAYILALLVLTLMFILCFLIFCIQQQHHSHLTQISHFIWFCATLLLFYLIYPFQLSIPIVFGSALSILFEYLTIKSQYDSSKLINNNQTFYLQSQMIIFIFIKILMHASVHVIGAHLKFSMEAAKRDTFLKVAHMNKAHMASQQDKQITERMIKSIMPPLFTHVFGKPEEFKTKVNCVHQMRPLFIYPVSEISILFADIVGFTRMSSNKTAEELVRLLNDLYGRFDRLCEQAGCEKISTLGDCYYCVSGCLNGREDHAKCCVEMGLLMVKEIEIFNKDHNVDVNMRVGVHTGTALCGFIGGKRFRFDVWSSDVTLANKMESSGRPGWVHISEDTFKKLDGKFNTEPGEKYSGKATYFVVRECKRETVAEALKMSENLQREDSNVNNR